MSYLMGCRIVISEAATVGGTERKKVDISVLWADLHVTHYKAIIFQSDKLSLAVHDPAKQRDIPLWFPTTDCQLLECTCMNGCHWCSLHFCHIWLYMLFFRSNERLAEANTKLLGERQRSKTLLTSSIMNGSLAGPALDAASLGSMGAYGASLGPLNRSLSLGSPLLGSLGEPQSNRVEAYLAKVSVGLASGKQKQVSFKGFSPFLSIISVIRCWTTNFLASQL